MKKCLICKRINEIKNNKNKFFVKELKTGYVVLEDYQFYRGYTIFLCKKHVFEIHELDRKYKNLFLEEMSNVAKAVFKAFKPVKLNYELLGNSHPHLHWHIIPRYKDDLSPKEPIWVIGKTKRMLRTNFKDLNKLKKKLLKNL